MAKSQLRPTLTIRYILASTAVELDGYEMRAINVLLLLSTRQTPEPLHEIEALVRWPTRDVPLAVTRLVHEYLTKGQSRVALYADEHDYPVLAEGTFERFVGFADGSEADEFRREYHRHPDLGPVPDRCIGFLLLSELKEIPPSRRLADLDASMESGRRLDENALDELDAGARSPFGLEKAAIYFVRGSQAPTQDEAIAMLRAKQAELHSKLRDLSARSESAIAKREQVQREKDSIEGDYESLRERSEKRGDKLEKRLQPLFSRAYANLTFERDSQEFVLHQDARAVWDTLDGLNSHGPLKSERFEGARGWREVEMGGPVRIYYRDLVGSRRGVLVSSKEDQAGRDTRYMRDNPG